MIRPPHVFVEVRWQMMPSNAPATTETGLTRRPAGFDVIGMYAGRRIHIVTGMVDRLVNVANLVQPCICSPLVTPYSSSWAYVTLDDRHKGVGIATWDKFHEEPARSQLHTAEDPLWWHRTTSAIPWLGPSDNALVYGHCPTWSSNDHDGLRQQVGRAHIANEHVPVYDCLLVNTDLYHHNSYIIRASVLLVFRENTIAI